jgi:hypothetical protein
VDTVTSVGLGPGSERPADPSLFSRLIDDAAVFPPGQAPLAQAVSDHLARTRYAGLVGPLVIPATAAADVAEIASGHTPSVPLRVALVARPGGPDAPVPAGVDRLADETAVEVVGVEVGWSGSWRGLQELGVPMAVEVPREGRDEAMADVAAGARVAGDPLVQAKFRTGATPTWAWPDEAELARFVGDCVGHGLRFKLTGGLHHAVRGEYPVNGTTEPQHGLLNVLVAVRSALQGADEHGLTSLLQERSSGPLAAMVADLTTDEAAAVRACFTAYGCCTVTDPIGELAALGLLEKE